MTGRTILLPDEEAQFQSWYADWAARAGIDPDPDNPEHRYDYRRAWKAGIEPQIDPTDQRYHWPSEFKADDHPNRFVGGVDTKTDAALTPGVGKLVPLREYLQRQRPAAATPSGEVVPVEQMVQQGARALIPRLQGPVELPKGHRVVPKTLSDAQPVATQYRQKLAESGPDFADVPATVARPYEIQTPREQATQTEIDRILKLLDEMAPEAPGA